MDAGGKELSGAYPNAVHYHYRGQIHRNVSCCWPYLPDQEKAREQLDKQRKKLYEAQAEFNRNSINMTHLVNKLSGVATALKNHGVDVSELNGRNGFRSD